MTGAYALIVTGNREHARSYSQALSRAGFNTQIVATGARAQVQLAFTRPDLVILDMNLPDMPGEVVLRQINAIPAWTTPNLFFAVPNTMNLRKPRIHPHMCLMDGWPENSWQPWQPRVLPTYNLQNRISPPL